MQRLSLEESNELEKICVICEICVKKLVNEIPREGNNNSLEKYPQKQ